MKNLKTKDEVLSELNKAGIKICLSRTLGCNSFHLVNESYGIFRVNAVVGTDFEIIKRFRNEFENINILINQ